MAARKLTEICGRFGREILNASIIETPSGKHFHNSLPSLHTIGFNINTVKLNIKENILAGRSEFFLKYQLNEKLTDGHFCDKTKSFLIADQHKPIFDWLKKNNYDHELHVYQQRDCLNPKEPVESKRKYIPYHVSNVFIKMTENSHIE